MKEKRESSVLIIYTGGTIGMMHDPETGSLIPLDFNYITKHLPVLFKSGLNINSVSFSPVKDSSDIDHEVWIQIADTIDENYEKYDGFVVLHGTDTMAYSASALSFMLSGLAKPVIFTGSQLPIGLLRTDGREHLITSLEIAAEKKNGGAMVPEVCIYFNNQLTRGNRTTKYNAENFDAFNSPNYPALAEVGLHIKYNTPNITYLNDRKKLTIHRSFDNNVAILKLFPGMGKDFVRSVMSTKGLKAIIIETYGSGNAPTYKWFLDEIRGFIKNGGIILNVTQCHGGSVEMGLYETSRQMLEAGVISGKDITSEASVTKLMHLLSRYNNRDEIIENLSIPLAGEIS